MITPPALRILEYEPRHRDAFRELNLAWIEEYFEVEETDREQLFDPEASILAPGGAILVAELGAEVVAVCALLAKDERHYELAKMATRKALRGSGIGRRLILAALEKARALGAHKVSLLSHHSLAPAIHLYRSVGFVDVEVPGCSGYARCDVAMEFVLG